MDIQFFNTSKLAVQLAKNEVSEKTTFLYFLANTILWTLVLYYGPATGAKVTWLTLYDLVVVLIVSVVGLIKCFEANGGSNGNNFLVRATCLSFPIGIKINILNLLLVWGILYFSKNYRCRHIPRSNKGLSVTHVFDIRHNNHIVL